MGRPNVMVDVPIVPAIHWTPATQQSRLTDPFAPAIDQIPANQLSVSDNMGRPNAVDVPIAPTIHQTPASQQLRLTDPLSIIGRPNAMVKPQMTVNPLRGE